MVPVIRDFEPSDISDVVEILRANDQLRFPGRNIIVVKGSLFLWLFPVQFPLGTQLELPSEKS